MIFVLVFGKRTKMNKKRKNKKEINVKRKNLIYENEQNYKKVEKKKKIMIK